MRNTALLAEFEDHPRPFTDDEIAIQELADREDVWPLCPHGAVHVQCFKCLEIALVEVRRYKKWGCGGWEAYIRRRKAKLITRPADQTAKAVARLRRRWRRSRETCVHRLFPHKCRICIEVEAVYLRIKARNANRSPDARRAT